MVLLPCWNSQLPRAVVAYDFNDVVTFIQADADQEITKFI